jgi:hypothetical protein
VDAHPRQPAPRPEASARRGAARSRLRSLARAGVRAPAARRRRAPARRPASPRADRSGSPAALVGRQRTNCAAWRKRVPCMWS